MASLKNEKVTGVISSGRELSESELGGDPDERNWTDREEAIVRKKIDCSVLPLLFLGLLVLQFDRMNLASALTNGFANDVSISQATINLGNQLLFLGIVVLEIPSNILLQRLGPHKWLSGQVLVFALLGAAQALIRNEPGFIASRMCLGLAESGYIPGALYTISMWYTKRERARRIACVFFGMFGGNALSPLLASGILNLDGTGGIKGWQWLFILEGAFTVVVSLLFFFFLPGSPDELRPLWSPGLIRFSEKEQHILQKRLELEGEGRQGLTRIPLKLVWKTLSHYRRWPHFLSTFCVFSTWSPLTTYTPSIIMALGFNRITANALAAVGGFLSVVVIFCFASLSDLTNRRGLTVILAQVCYLIVLIVTRSVHPYVGVWSRWALWTVVNGFSVGYHPSHQTWLQVNCREAGERSISIAMWVMSANLGMMVGTQYYEGYDAPFYSNGLRIQIIMVATGMTLAIIQEIVYVIHNRRVREGKYEAHEGEKPMIYSP